MLTRKLSEEGSDPLLLKSCLFLKNQKGQGLIEYLIIVALVGVAAIGVMRVVGHNVSIQFANVSRSISGQGGELKAEEIKRDHYSKRDLSDFMKGSHTSKSGNSQ